MGIFSRHPKGYATTAGATPGYAAPVQTAAPPAPAMAGGVVGTQQVTTTTTTTYNTGAPGAMAPNAMAAPARRRGRLGRIFGGGADEGRAPVVAAPNSRTVDYAYGHKQPHHRHGAQAYDYADARN
jgi:hypothetical protein